MRQLTRLGLQENKLEGAMPTELGLMQQRLTFMGLYENRLELWMPTEICLLTGLKELVLGSR